MRLPFVAFAIRRGRLLYVFWFIDIVKFYTYENPLYPNGILCSLTLFYLWLKTSNYKLLIDTVYYDIRECVSREILIVEQEKEVRAKWSCIIATAINDDKQNIVFPAAFKINRQIHWKTQAEQWKQRRDKSSNLYRSVCSIIIIIIVDVGQTRHAFHILSSSVHTFWHGSP